jgi:hypothetical protein
VIPAGTVTTMSGNAAHVVDAVKPSQPDPEDHHRHRLVGDSENDGYGEEQRRDPEAELRKDQP